MRYKNQMWIEDLPNGKYKYFERYRDPLTEKLKKVSVTLDKKTPRAQKVAQAELLEKIESKINNSSTSNAKFTDIAEEWWSFYKKSIKQSSISALQSSFNFIIDYFDKDIKISNVTSKVIQKFINDADCPRSKLERSKSTLNLIFDYAVDLEYIEYNPARKAKLPKKIQTVKDLKKIQNKYLEQNELKALLSELYSRPNTRRLALLAEFMSLNGCRMGEAIALKKENYKRSERKIDIHGTLDKTVGYSKGVKTTPKTASSFRTVDLSDREIEILDEIIEQNNLSKSVRNDYNEMGYIFVSKRGIPLQTNSFNLAIKRANSRLKSPINKNLSSRHTLISYLAENNVPLKAIVDRVGHKDGGKTTTAIYTHVTENMKSSIIDILNKKN
jgi:integrase